MSKYITAHKKALPTFLVLVLLQLTTAGVRMPCYTAKKRNLVTIGF